MSKLRVLDLFSGIGGFSLGLERTGGFETVAFCEIEPFPRRVLAKHWPGVPCYENVNNLTGNALARDRVSVDVITGGFPCQDISLAGPGAGINGTRSGLFFQVERLIGELGPKWVILENVAALLGRGLAAVLQSFSALGLHAGWHCIPASAVGAVQNRDRVWIVANPCKDRMQRFLAGFDLGAVGQRRACRQADLPQVYAAPLAASRWPQPIVCGGRGRFPHWVDRVGALGNSVYPDIPELIGHAILAAEART